ncbi:hypothetical protein BV22DRAFT_1026972, partial [Leucogyrophana mollusca]
INLVVGDYFKMKGRKFVETASNAAEITKWFNNHSIAYGIFNREQELTYSKALTLILPVITRWTAHYLSFSRLLEVKTPLACCVMKHRNELITSAGPKRESKDKARKVLDTVEDPDTWRDITS